jgi:hypothetical protein
MAAGRRSNTSRTAASRATGSTGLDEFVDRVVPELQDRGVHRADCEHETLRGHLGLGVPEVRPVRSG